MTPISLHSLTGIPELLLLVADYLEPQDIACCMATCKALARNLEPHLWKHIIIKEKCPPEKAVLEYRHIIRTLSIYSYKSVENYLKTLTQDIPSAPHQRQLDSIPTDNRQESLIFRFQKVEMKLFGRYRGIPPTVTPNLITVIYQSHLSLTSLTITAAMIRDNLQDLAEARIWDRLHNLRDLTILPGRLDIDVELVQVIQWMSGCFRHPRLTKLHCLFSLSSLIMGNTGMQVWTEAARERIERTGESSRIKDLRLPMISTSYSGYDESFLIPFLKVLGPGLERMSAPTLLGNYRPVLIETVQSHCPNLRHLATAMQWSEACEVQDVIAMVQACRHTGLESFHFNCSKPGHPSHQNTLFKELVAHHAATLQVIENERGTWSPECQLHLMEKCSNLRRLWFDPNILVSSDAYCFYVRNVGHEWVCLQLRELVLIYSLDAEDVNETRALFTQLGRLVHLEVLAIGMIPKRSKTFKDMTLRDGYLNMLAGLNKMRHLHVSRGMWNNLGPEEVAFIKQKWPLLQRVSFGCSKEQFNEIRVQDHWARLCEERPWIKLSRGYQP